MNNQERKVCYKCFPTLVPKGGLVEPFVNNQIECSKNPTWGISLPFSKH